MHQLTRLTNDASLPRHILAGGLIALWLVVVLGLAVLLPVPVASWLTFIALLIAPGYLLADLIAWRIGLDGLEQLALALPLGVTILAIPGTYVLLRHLTIVDLFSGWILLSGLVLIAWLAHGRFVRRRLRLVDGVWQQPRAITTPWRRDEIALLLLLLAGYLVALPTLNLHKIDGDAYAVNAFAADALAGLPLNQTEPLFGTELGPGVRMIFNQTLPLSYLWSYLADIDPITLTASASRAVLALWALLAVYSLGRAAGNSRRFGLITAAIQLLIYLAAPFIRGDSASLFFFERINADKFLVPVTMLPVIFGLAIRYLRNGRRDIWLAAAAATLAVSAIHPLVAAMLALAIGAYGGFHLLVALADRLTAVPQLQLAQATRRAGALFGLVALVMLLPVAQLIISRGEAPLAASYPRSFEGWSIGARQVPALPFVHVPTLDLYGPLPELARLEASAAEGTADPFLIWRFAVNMNRRRIILFDIDRYISDPSLILEPPYLLAILLLPLLLWGVRRDLAAQFAIGASLAVVFVMFNPLLTPLIGSLVMPWILWRLIWVLPYALTLALAARRLWFAAQGAWARRGQLPPARRLAYAPLGGVLLAALLLSPAISRNLRNLNERATAPYFYPTPDRILARLNTLTHVTGPATVMADADLSVTIPAYVANASIVAHRAPTTSEVFPADRQAEALQRLLDQDRFFRASYLTDEMVEILHRYDVRFIVAASGSDLDMQLRLAPHWFSWLLDDQSYSLFAVHQLPAVTMSVRGNSAVRQRQWDVAERRYQVALRDDPSDLLALVGLAESAHAQGRFNDALAWLQEAIGRVELPVLYHRMGQIYAERGQVDESIAAFRQAQEAAPRIARFNVSLGDACLQAGIEACTAVQFAAAVANQTLPDEPARLIAQGDLWRQRNRIDPALPLYEAAADRQPSQANLFILERAYREAGQLDQAEALVRRMRFRHPFSAEVVAVAARLDAARGNVDDALRRYRYAIWLQELQAQESYDTRLALAQTLLDDGRLDEAQPVIERAVTLRPFNAAGHRLRGDLLDRQQQYEAAIDAYQRAFELDPTRIEVYIALSDQLRLHGERPDAVLDLLQSAIQLNPQESTLLLALGDQLQQVGNELAAINVYESALSLLNSYSFNTAPGPRASASGPARAFAYARLAGVYENLADWDPALNYYRAAVVAAPELAWTHVVLGDALRRGGDRTEAQASYERALRINPDEVDARVGLAELALERARYSQAQTLLDEALALAPDNAAIYIRLGELARQRGDHRQALERYRQAAGLPLTGATVNVNLIDALRQYGDTDGVLAYAQAAAVYRPTDIDLLLRLGQLQRTVGQLVEAEATLLKARRLDRRDGRLFAELAELNLARGEPRTALVFYQQAIELSPSETSFYINLSQLWAAQGHPEQAIAILRGGQGRASRPADLAVALASRLLQQGQPAEALAALEAARQALPGNLDLRLALVAYYNSRAEFETAAAELEAMRAAYPQHAVVRLALAELNGRQGKLTTALDHCRTAVALEPGNPNTHLALANVYQQLGRMDDAIAAVAQSLVVAPAQVSGYVTLAALYEAEENWGAARLTYEHGLRVSPTSAQLLGPYAWLLARRGEPDRALALFDGAMSEGAGASLLVGRAVLFRRLDRLDDARRDLETALQQAPGDVGALLALGDLQRAAGAFDAAQTRFEQVVALQPGSPVGYLRLGALANQQGNREAAAAYVEAARAAEPGALIRPDDTSAQAPAP